ncbi:MAG TPA: ribulose-phosphate 3-epimerase, partial [Thermoplasmata archaeon]|nr:ribulose-phosphate 3-epimerase [Thermoplasmata archaeon]
GGTTLVVHAEAADPVEEAVLEIRKLGVGVGVAMRPGTPFSRVQPLLDRLDQVLVMSVHPGFSGQKFLPEILPKLREVRHQLDAEGRAIELSIDGGITQETIRTAGDAGASFFVCGNSVFAGGDIGKNLQALRAALTAATP